MSIIFSNIGIISNLENRCILFNILYSESPVLNSQGNVIQVFSRPIVIIVYGNLTQLEPIRKLFTDYFGEYRLGLFLTLEEALYYLMFSIEDVSNTIILAEYEKIYYVVREYPKIYQFLVNKEIKFIYQPERLVRYLSILELGISFL